MQKYLLTLLMLFTSLGIYADDQEVEHTHEDEYEEGCSNEVDDDMDGDVDGDDEDCLVVAAFTEGTDDLDVSAYLVWGLGIALISSVGGDSGTGTATTE